ncbi:MAG TPA: hypothetical protein DEG12_02230 [Alistipes sp.]|nr:hypothetical protein [Alistipes sp.]HBW10841.1 hypothetical protein [Alistipes sp.]
MRAKILAAPVLFRKKDALDKRLIHCNFGWGGTANGYYYYGAFDLRNGPEAGRCGGREGW